MCSTWLKNKANGDYLETNPTTELLAEATERTAQLQTQEETLEKQAGLSSFTLHTHGRK